MELTTGRPMSGAVLARVRAFLAACGLDWDDGIGYTCALEEDGEILATGSLDGATVKCLAVSPNRRGEDLTARVLTDLRREAFERGFHHLTLFTKPENEALLRPFGFYPVARAEEALMMESERDGLQKFLDALERPEAPCAEAGCVVANCNPITNGHLYLIQTAARACGCLHLFILSEERGPFPAADRIRLAREACRDIPNVLVHPTGPYMVSAATFPAYFLRDPARVGRASCEMDIRLFGEKIAPALKIACRYVGTEPYSEVTRFYNEQLRARLPEYGIRLVEVPRLEEGSEAVSASRVRKLYESGDFDAIRPLVPECTLQYLTHRKGA